MKELIWKKFETERLFLDKIPKADVPKDILTIEELHFWYGYEIEKPYSPLLLEADAWSWHLIEKATDQIIGYIGIGGIRERIGVFNFHYLLKESHKHKGYMTEAAIRVLDFAFKELELRMCFVYIHEFNTPSIKLVERLGFTLKSKGNAVQHYILGDGNDMVYKYKKQEWIEFSENNLER
jgi:ribosomal-protein-alanine N-acetyltransferase